MKFKVFLLTILIAIGLGAVGCSESNETSILNEEGEKVSEPLNENKKVSTPLGEGEYQNYLNANGEPLEGQLFLLVESSKDIMTDENIVKFYDEVISKAKHEDFEGCMVKCGEYGLSFFPGVEYINYGKIKTDCRPLLANSKLESVDKYLVVENGKVKESK